MSRFEGDGDDRPGFAPRQFPDWRELPSDYVDLAQLRAAVREAIQSLPDKYREIYVMSDNQRLSMEELAAVLEISTGSAKTRLHRARLMVQEKLAPSFRGTWKDRLQMLKGMNPWSPARK